ncbi:MAG: hypothetical protein QXY18_05395 [Nitrososphaerota archaeon]
MSYAFKILAITIAFFLILEIIIYGFKMISNIDKEEFANAPNPLEWIKNSTISNEILLTNSSKKGNITICSKTNY